LNEYFYSPITDAPDLDKTSNCAGGNVGVGLIPSEDANDVIML
jgi:hypothetical protein